MSHKHKKEKGANRAPSILPSHAGPYHTQPCHAVPRLASAAQNNIRVITPYVDHGQWVFDDESVGLVREPLIAGIDDMLDLVTADIDDADKGVTLLFSHRPFPGYQIELDLIREEDKGHWYQCDELGTEGWLCPALGKYFDEAPQHIYVEVKAINERQSRIMIPAWEDT